MWFTKFSIAKATVYFENAVYLKTPPIQPAGNPAVLQLEDGKVKLH
jgi:hypothetical protein